MPDLNIEPEDLDQEPLPTPPSPAASEDLLVIDTADLDTAPPLPAPPSAWREAAVPKPGSDSFLPPPLPGEGAGGEAPRLSSSHLVGWGLLFQLALAGALGGLLAWAVNEPFTDDRREMEEPLLMLLRMAGFGAALGGMIGAALGSVEGLSAGVVDKALRGAGLGLLVGGAGGALGGLFGQLLYGVLQPNHLPGRGDFLPLTFARAIAWSLVGVFIGLGQGAQGASPRKLVNGLLGGAIGGFAGGLLFDPIGVTVQFFVSGDGAHVGWLSRLVAMVVLGFCTGAAIALVQELRKEAWLIVIGGPLSGKQFILYRPLTTVGSSPKADICLLKDPALLPQHFQLQQSGPAHLLTTAPEAVVAISGRPTTRHHLRSGDLIMVGNTVLEYRLKALQQGPM